MKLYAVQTVRWHGEIKYVYKDVHNGGIKVEGRQELIDIAAEQIRASLFAFLLCKSHVSMPQRYIYLCSFQPWAVLTFARASLYHGSCTVDPFLFFFLALLNCFQPGHSPFLPYLRCSVSHSMLKILTNDVSKSALGSRNHQWQSPCRIRLIVLTIPSC